MDIKLLVLDVDGTLLNSNREMSERTIKILKKVIFISFFRSIPTSSLFPITSYLPKILPF